MAVVGMTEAEFNDILAKVEDNLAKVLAAARYLYDRATAALDWIPARIKADIDGALQRIVDIAQKVSDFLKEFIENPGWPPALWHASNVWTDEVGSKASSVAGRATLNYVSVDDHWTGPAATAYKNTLPAQSAAAVAIKATCDALDTALKNMAFSIVGFWLACLYGLLKASVQCESVEVAADTVIGIPEAIGAFVQSVAELILRVTGAAAALYAFVNSQVGPYTSMKQQLNNWTSFPPRGDSQGNWPQAVNTETADGSFADGDPSGWRFQA